MCLDEAQLTRMKLLRRTSSIAQMCAVSSICHHPCSCWAVVLPCTLWMSLLILWCRGCVSLSPPCEEVPAHPDWVHSKGEKQCQVPVSHTNYLSLWQGQRCLAPQL